MVYFKAMPNSIDFYKGIFLYVIPVRIIVTWSYLGALRDLLTYLVYAPCAPFLFHQKIEISKDY